MKAGEITEQYKQGHRDFTGTDLDRENLTGASLAGITLTGASLIETKFILCQSQ